MTNQDFTNAMANYKKGTYVSATWKSENGDYLKVSKGVVRVLNKQVQLNKANVEYVRLTITHNSKLKTKVHYFKNGVEITKQEYEMVIAPSNKTIDKCFTKHLCDIIAIG